MKDIKQGVSKFTEKDLTPNSAHSFTEGSDIGPLETHVQSELEKIQAGHEGYKMVPVELWQEVISFIAISVASDIARITTNPEIFSRSIKEHSLLERCKHI